jgi:hypothetical protein
MRIRGILCWSVLLVLICCSLGVVPSGALLAFVFGALVLWLYLWSIAWAYYGARVQGERGWLVMLRIALWGWPLGLPAYMVFGPEAEDRPQTADSQTPPPAHNRHIALSSLLAAAILWTLAWAYLLEYPRVEAALGALSGDVIIPAREIPGANVGSKSFHAELETRLQSKEFVKRLCAHGSRWLPLVKEGASGVIATPFSDGMVSALADVVVGQGPSFIIGEPDYPTKSVQVVYLLFRAYRVSEPSLSGIARLQTWLPGIPRPARLAKDAEAANQAVKEAIQEEIRRAIREIASPAGADAGRGPHASVVSRSPGGPAARGA